MADLTEIDGFDLRNQGFGAATRSGRYNLPSKRGENLVLAGSSGSAFVANKPFEEGSGALNVWCIGATQDGSGNLTIPSTFQLRKAQFETNMAMFERFFTRAHKLSLIRATQPDGSTRRAYVEWREWSEPEIQAGGTRAEWTISYTIPKVWWEDENTTTQSAVAGATSPKTLNLTSFANMTGVIDDATFTVAGPVTNPRITDTETGNWVQYTGTVPSGSSWVVNVDAFTSTVGGSTVLSATTHKGSYKLLPIPNCFGTSNTPQVTLIGSAMGTATNLTVTARRKWAHG